MASERSERPGGQDPRPCPPCGGSGRVISTLGGAAERVSCPWCEGTGRRLDGHDAQARFAARSA